jgi:hypothetical protein
MKTKNLHFVSLALVVAFMLAFSGCASKKELGSLETGMIMKYQASPEKELMYTGSFEFEQNMTVREQEYSVQAMAKQDFKMRPLVHKGDDLMYEVTIEDMSSSITAPQGEHSGDMKNVIGKSFSLTLSPQGKELDFSGAENITYNYGMGESKSLASDIQAFFPDLPDHPVKPGDSWESVDDIVEKGGSGQINLVFNHTHTFEKLETFNGYECMKINDVFTGTLDGKGAEQGMELVTKGELSGSGTWYYAYKEGILVSQAIEGQGTTNTEVVGQDMNIPARRTYHMKTELK